MDKQHNSQTPRVVRTGPKTSRRRRKKPLTKTQRIVKTIFATVGKVILSTALVLTITGCIVGTALTIYVMQFVKSDDAAINLSDLELSYTSVMYDKDGAEMQRLYEGGQNRIWVDLKDIPTYVQDAFIYVEDERFRDHEGVDFKRTLGAFLNFAKNLLHIGDETTQYGGSTITQQLIKNINGDIQNRSIDVKIREIMQAMNVERHYSKDQILELYLNYIGLGNGVNGVQAAANYYFNKDISEVTVNEAAALAIITKSPNKLNPLYVNKKTDKTDYEKWRNDRRQYCLKKMCEFGAITEAEKKQYMDVPVTVKQEDTGDKPIVKSTIYSYYVDAVLNQVVEDLGTKLGYTADYAEQMIKTSGYKIYTNQDTGMQRKLESMFENDETFGIGAVNEKAGIPDGAMTILDLDGNVRALVGGRGQKTTSRGFNRATQAVQMFGSTIKPLSIYAPAFDYPGGGLINWSMLVNDQPKMDLNKDGKLEWPKNYDTTQRGYSGEITIIEALRVSKNTIPVELCNLMTPQYCYDYLTNNFSFDKLVKDMSQVGPDTMALGSAGTSLLDLTAAYQIFGNGGYYTEPRLYTKVVDSEGKVILDTGNYKRSKVLSPETAYIMNKALEVVVTSGSGSSANLASSGFQTVGKTGTTNERENLLFVGVTPYYVAGIRYGNDDNKPIPNKPVGNTQVGVWKKIMLKVLDGYNPAKFELSAEGVVTREYCKKTGLLLGPDCTEKGVGYYKIGQEPAQCSGHKPESSEPTSSEGTSSGTSSTASEPVVED